MSQDIDIQFQESIKLEQNISALYLEYSKLFCDDSEFWLKLSKEEINHSQLINTLFEEYLPKKMFPIKIFDPDIRRLKQMNFQIEEMLKRISANKIEIDKKSFYQFAENIEKTSGEHFYQELMSDKSNFESVRLAQDMNKEDKDHAQRINELINKLK